MKRKWQLWLMALVVLLVLAACGNEEKAGQSEEEPKAEENTEQAEQTGAESGTKEITYLGETYTVPEQAERIVIAGAMEAMEDAMSLEVEPVGAVTVAGEFPEVYKDAMGNAESIGEKQQPNFEKILQLKPDVILGTTKFPDEVKEKLQQIAPTIFVSHVSSDWEDNLKLMGALSGKEDKADELLADYRKNVEEAKGVIEESYNGKKVVMMRVRGGKMFVYNEEFYFNPALYHDLGLEVPEPIKKAQSQEEISVEQLAELNPDYLFMQVQESGTQENEQAFEQLEQNPIMKNINAFKEEQVYVNAVPSLLEGGPLFSRNALVTALQENH